MKTRSLRRVFQTGVEYRGVFGAISKVLWETCGKLRVSEIAFHKSYIAPSPVAASTGLPSTTALIGREAKRLLNPSPWIYPQIMRKTQFASSAFAASCTLAWISTIALSAVPSYNYEMCSSYRGVHRKSRRTGIIKFPVDE